MRKLAIAFMILFVLSPTSFAQPEIHINIPAMYLVLADDGKVIKRYPVAVGTPYMPTPTGNFKVIYKEKNPTWYPGSEFKDKTPVPPGPDNPLGTRWIEFKPGYGIHGTNKAWSIDYPVSDGCVRMFNVDVEELYELVEIGASVNISYQTMAVIEKPDGLYLRVYADIYNTNTSQKDQFATLIEPYRARYLVIEEPKWPITVEYPKVYEQKITLRK